MTNAYKALFLEKVGLKSIDEIPSTIPILRWEWVKSGERKSGLGRWHDFATYKDHVVFEPGFPEGDEGKMLSDRQQTKQSNRRSNAMTAHMNDVDPNDSDNGDAEISQISYVFLLDTSGDHA